MTPHQLQAIEQRKQEIENLSDPAYAASVLDELESLKAALRDAEQTIQQLREERDYAVKHKEVTGKPRDVRPVQGWGGLRAQAWNVLLDHGLKIHEADILIGTLSAFLVDIEQKLNAAQSRLSALTQQTGRLLEAVEILRRTVVNGIQTASVSLTGKTTLPSDHWDLMVRYAAGNDINECVRDTKKLLSPPQERT